MQIKGYYCVCGMVACLLMLCAGCAQVMCINNPAPFKPTTLSVGNNRTTVLSEMGQPAGSDQRENTMTETYVYKDGGSANMWGWKVLRIVGYTAGDLVTLWIDQVIRMPLEACAFNGAKYSATAEYERQKDGPWKIKSDPVIVFMK